MSTAPVSNESSAPASAAAAPPTQEQGTRPWALGPPIRVGDVGFVCDGVFCRLFHPAQRDLGVPRGFAPLPMPEHVLDMQANVPEDAAGRNEWCVLPVVHPPVPSNAWYEQGWRTPRATVLGLRGAYERSCAGAHRRPWTRWGRRAHVHPHEHDRLARVRPLTERRHRRRRHPSCPRLLRTPGHRPPSDTARAYQVRVDLSFSVCRADIISGYELHELPTRSRRSTWDRSLMAMLVLPRPSLSPMPHVGSPRKRTSCRSGSIRG
jgi:hypothetical protein